MDFDYEASNREGRVLRGRLAAGSERELIQLLREQDLLPITIKPVTRAGDSPRWSGSRQKDVSIQDVCLVIRELATMLGAGVSLAESVESTAQAHGGSKLGVAFDGIHAQLRAGEPLSVALRAAALPLPEYIFQLVEAGELTGQLAEALRSGADQMEYEQRIRQEMRNALIYPSVLVFSGIGATLLIFLMVVPKFANLLKNPKAKLPDISVWVLQTGLFVKENLLWFGLGSFGVVVAIGMALSVPSTRQALREWAARLPVLGEWLVHAELGRWAAMLGNLLANKVPIVRAMELAQQGVGLQSLQARLGLAVRDLRAGKRLAETLALHRTVSPMGVNLVRVGERTGELPEMLRTLGRIYENGSRERMKRFLILFEPVAILVVGALIGFIMVAIMLAITSLSTSSF